MTLLVTQHRRGGPKTTTSTGGAPKRNSFQPDVARQEQVQSDLSSKTVKNSICGASRSARARLAAGALRFVIPDHAQVFLT